MSKFTHGDTVYRPKCISCGSSNVTMVSNTKGFGFRCNKCKKKTRYYGTLDELLRNPGMFKPNPMYNVTVDSEVKETYKADAGQLTDADLEFLQTLQVARSDSRSTAVWTLVEDRYEPCWEKLAEAYELYDPDSSKTLAVVPEPLTDIGRLKCIPVKHVSSPLSNTMFLTKEEADAIAASLEGVEVLELMLSQDDTLANLLEIVSRVNWSRMIS